MENLPDQFKTFWDHVVYVWNNGFMGVDIASLLIAAGIFVGFLVIRGIFSKYVLYRLQKWTDNTKTKVDDKIIDALIPPIKFIHVVLGLLFAGNYLAMPENVEAIFTNVIRSLIAFTIFWGIYRALDPLSHSFKKLEKILSKAMVQWLFKAVKLLVVFLGAAVILELWGIEVGPLLAGLGLFGVAVALGAQDLFKNLIAGLTIIAEKRFHPGEWISVDGVVEGTVEDIGFRSTKVRRFDKAPVDVPNAQLSDAVVTNFSRMTFRRIFMKIGVLYSTKTEQLKTIVEEIEKYIKNNDDFEVSDDVSTFVRVESFNSSSIDIMIYCFTKTKVWGEWLQIREELVYAIKDIVENKAKTEFAFPSQTMYLDSVPDEMIEVLKASNDMSAKKQTKTTRKKSA